VSLIATDKMLAVIGLGKTGMACARYLAAQGKPFYAIEENGAAASVMQFKAEFPNVALITGPMTFDDLRDAGRLVVSPGLPLNKPALVEALQAGIEICCDIDLLVENTSAPVIAITGSNAKSTVTSLVGEMAQRAGMVVGVGGNIGTPALELLMESRDFELFVLELSSFQLERMKPLNAEVACILNISPDHMDRYEGLSQYHAAKHRIFMGCKTAVFNRADALTTPLLPDSTKRLSFGLDSPDFKAFGLVTIEGEEYIAHEFQELMPLSEVTLLGRHNVENVLAALAIGTAANIPKAAMLETLRSFKGLPHRCERVATVDDVLFINDSKGTNIGATVAAINGFADARRDNIVLIAGGVGKGADFDLLAKQVKSIKSAIVIGEDGPKIEAALLSRGISCVDADSLEKAVSLAYEDAAPGDVVLFSPACASFDMFQGYAHRGDCFASIVRALPGSKS